MKFLEDNIQYLRTGRVELGAITAKVDYNRAIDVPEKVYPHVFDKVIEKIDNKLKSVLKDSYDYWKETLNPFEGFINNTGDKLKEIDSDMRDNVLMAMMTIRISLRILRQ
jgi:hypothetical protein